MHSLNLLTPSPAARFSPVSIHTHVHTHPPLSILSESPIECLRKGQLGEVRHTCLAGKSLFTPSPVKGLTLHQAASRSDSGQQKPEFAYLVELGCRGREGSGSVRAMLTP